ncbi:MAG: hypothetical protein IPP71_04365 [Bacteroidetes bacterium]|nr:hypothetical protein [Bacteroidota bacterium]
MPPDYFAKTSEEGVFAIRNVKPGSYRLFALTDKNQNLIYDLKDETVGFVSDAFNLIDSLNFIVPVTKQLPLTQSVKNYSIEDPAKLITTFSRPLLNPSFKFISGKTKNVLAEYSTFKDTVNLFCEPFGMDTIKIVWYENEIPFDTVQYKKTVDKFQKMQHLKKAAPWTSYPVQSSALKAETNPSIKWSAPIIIFDTTLVAILKDSLPFAAKIYFTDSLKTNLQAEGNWNEGNYTFVILPLAVTDMYDRINDSVVVAFSVPGERTVGSISFKLQTQKSGSYILQLVNEKDAVLRQRITNGKMEGLFEQVEPGTFRLRIVYDENGNGRWDSGDYRKGIQPEVIEYNMEVITVRANWEVEVDWIQ